MMRNAILALLTIMLGTTASAQTSTVVNTIKVSAWAAVIARKCKTLEVNWSKYSATMLMAGLKPEDIEPEGKHGQLYRGFVREALNETNDNSEAAACAVGEVMYGPNGRNVPKLLVSAK